LEWRLVLIRSVPAASSYNSAPAVLSASGRAALSSGLNGEDFAERLRDMIDRLDKIKSQIEDVALDEMSEAYAYAEMAKSCLDKPDIASLLFLIAIDSILHRELAWAVLRAVSEIQVLAKEVIAHMHSPGIDEDKLREMVRIHESIEVFAKSSYQGLVDLAEPGTTLRRLLELLVSEEEKHRGLVKAALAKLRGA